MKNITKLLIFTVFCTVMVSVTLSEKSDFVPNISILELIVASADGGESGSSINCSRIKTWCSCYDGSNNFTRIRILTCEDYTIEPPTPISCDTCITNSCPSGSNCR